MDFPILHLISSSGFYGAERMLLDHCLTIPGQHQVVLMDAPLSLVQRFENAGVPTRLVANQAELRSLIQATAGNPLLVSHNFKAQVMAILAARKEGCRVLVVQHGFTPTSVKQRCYRLLSLHLCRLACVKAVMCVSARLFRDHRQAGIAERKLTTIPNGLPAAPELPVREPSQHENSPEASSTPTLRLGYAGRLSHEKGPDILLEALAIVRASGVNCQLRIAGEGPMKAALIAQAERLGLSAVIEFCGYQDNMPRWLADCDALVLPSRTEGTPMVLLEAMQQRIPVAACAVGGIPDVIDQHSAWLVPAQQPKALAHALVDMAKHPAERRARATLAYTIQQGRYSLAAQADVWQALYYRAATL